MPVGEGKYGELAAMVMEKTSATVVGLLVVEQTGKCRYTQRMETWEDDDGVDHGHDAKMLAMATMLEGVAASMRADVAARIDAKED